MFVDDDTETGLLVPGNPQELPGYRYLVQYISK